jgi:hypothetical protein
MPASGVAMPCAAADTGIKASVGIVDHSDPASKRAMAKASRSANFKDTMKPPTYADVRMVLLKGQCDGEVTTGDYEAWIDCVMTAWKDPATAAMMAKAPAATGGGGGSEIAGNVGSYVGKQVGNKLLNFVPLGLGGVVGSQVGESMARRDAIGTAGPPTTAPTATLVLIAMQATDKAGSVTVTSMTTNGKEGVTSMVTTVQPGPPVRALTRMYSDATLTNEMRTLDGDQHGAQINHAHFNKQHNLQIPGSMLCFDEGEQIKTTACDVE